MKKFLVGLLTVALAASMLVGCGKKEEKKKADNSLKDVQSKKDHSHQWDLQIRIRIS